MCTSTLSLVDYQAIQLLNPLGRTRNTTYLTISAGAVEDLNMNPLEAVLSNMSIPVTEHTG